MNEYKLTEAERAEFLHRVSIQPRIVGDFESVKACVEFTAARASKAVEEYLAGCGGDGLLSCAFSLFTTASMMAARFGGDEMLDLAERAWSGRQLVRRMRGE